MLFHCLQFPHFHFLLLWLQGDEGESLDLRIRDDDVTLDDVVVGGESSLFTSSHVHFCLHVHVLHEGRWRER